MIEAHELKKSFGAVKAVTGVSFAASDGRITGLLGPNGAGKSTTLRILYTVLRPDSGYARIDGLDVVTNALDVRTAIGVLPHSAGLYPHLTARENVAYYGRMTGLVGKKLNAQVDKMIELLEISDFAQRKAKGFSQGERTKVALARALVHYPKNVILDEPTNGLDVMATRALRKLILRLKEDGRCILFSSHVMQEVAALCDEIIIIGAGKVAAHGSPDALRAQTGQSTLEDAFVHAIGSAEGLD